MAEVLQVKVVKAGGWRTLESGWNTSFTCIFHDPAGAQVKVRYGDGWPFGRDSLRQTLDGLHDKSVGVGRVSVVYARVQMNVQHDTEVRYAYVVAGP